MRQKDRELSANVQRKAASTPRNEVWGENNFPAREVCPGGTDRTAVRDANSLRTYEFPTRQEGGGTTHNCRAAGTGGTEGTPLHRAPSSSEGQHSSFRTFPAPEASGQLAKPTGGQVRQGQRWNLPASVRDWFFSDIRQQLSCPPQWQKRTHLFNGSSSLFSTYKVNQAFFYAWQYTRVSYQRTVLSHPSLKSWLFKQLFI